VTRPFAWSVSPQQDSAVITITSLTILACNELVPNLTYAWQFVVFGLVGGGGHLYNDFQTPSLL
jgi:hypothetical protein